MMKIENVDMALINDMVIDVLWNKRPELSDSGLRAIMGSEWVARLTAEAIHENYEELTGKQIFQFILSALVVGMEIGTRIAERLEPGIQAAEREVQ